jgi:hypothetical protein
MRKRTDTVQDIINNTDLGAKIWVAFDSVRHHRESMDHEFRELMNGHRYAKGWDVLLGDIGWELFEVIYCLQESIQKERVTQLLDLMRSWGGHPKRNKAVVLPFQSETPKRARRAK